MLEVKNVSVSYGETIKALSEVSFSVAAGESAALIGANGAGKTTLLHSILGILPVTEGSITVNDIVLAKKTTREIRSKTGLVFQNPDDQLFMPTIFEDAAFGPRSYGLSEEETKARVESALTALNIPHLSERSPLKLSGGEKRLCAIATVLTMNPDYLLFDEPTAFLDPRARRLLIETINALPQGKLIATHDLDFARKTCSRVILLQNGSLVADGGIELLDDEALLTSAGL